MTRTKDKDKCGAVYVAKMDGEDSGGCGQRLWIVSA